MTPSILDILRIEKLILSAPMAGAAGPELVAQGWEAGGHVWGQISTMALIPAVVDAVDVPVVAWQPGHC